MGLIKELVALGNIVLETMQEVKAVRDSFETPSGPGCPYCGSRRTQRSETVARVHQINEHLRKGAPPTRGPASRLEPLPNSGGASRKPAPPRVQSEHWSCLDCSRSFQRPPS